MDDRQIELTPYRTGPRPLSGFILGGRWPDTVVEWSQLLTLVVRLAAAPGLLNRATVFGSRDERPEPGGGVEHPVGMLVLEGPVIGADAPAPGTLGHPMPSAMLLLHPPGETSDAGASGCLLLPGIPHLGLDHRAAWVETETDGSLRRLVSESDVDPLRDPDTAVLATLLAA